MARIRSIKPEFFTSMDVACLSMPARLMFIGLWTHADDAGRERDEPRLIKAALFPLDDKITTATVDKLMAELAEAGRIVRYEVDDVRLFQVVNWSHQKIDRPRESKYRGPFDEASTNHRRRLDEDSTW